MYDLKHVPLEFEVKQGEIVYIGDVNVDVEKWNDDKKYQHVPEGISVVVEDRGDRDIQVFVEKFDDINPADIKKKILLQSKTGE